MPVVLSLFGVPSLRSDGSLSSNQAQLWCQVKKETRKFELIGVYPTDLTLMVFRLTVENSSEKKQKELIGVPSLLSEPWLDPRHDFDAECFAAPSDSEGTGSRRCEVGDGRASS